MTLALIGLAVVLFALLAGLVYTVSERRHRRWTRRQWEERERLLNRRSPP